MKNTMLLILFWSMLLSCQQEPTTFIYPKVNVKFNQTEDKISIDLLFKIGNDTAQTPHVPKQLSIGNQAFTQKENASRGVYFQYKGQFSSLENNQLQFGTHNFDLPLNGVENVKVLDLQTNPGGLDIQWSGKAPQANEKWQILLKPSEGSLQIFDIQPTENSFSWPKERFQRLPQTNYKGIVVRRTPLDTLVQSVHYFGQVESKSNGFEFELKE